MGVVKWLPVPHVSRKTRQGLAWAPHVGESILLPIVCSSHRAGVPQITLAAAAAAMDELGEGRAKKARTWPWWAGASAAQLTAGLVWFRRGKRGGDMTMPFRAFAIATLVVGAGATAVTAGVSAAGVGSVAEMKDLGARIRRWSRVPPRRVQGGE